ncbi:hypothetical protein ABXN37_27470 [Piscinibacter sakaiensis]|uniref:hypothetical protein n=1 Tax=Piscinibacter sakaiensis TaxID=1547922 RepID=UPI00372A82A9
MRADGEVDLYPLLGHLFTLADIGREQGREGPRARGAALFHLSLADALARWARAAAEAQALGQAWAAAQALAASPADASDPRPRGLAAGS